MEFQFSCPKCRQRHKWDGNIFRCGIEMIPSHMILLSKMLELEMKINSLFCEKPVCIAIREKEGDNPSPSQNPDDWVI